MKKHPRMLKLVAKLLVGQNMMFVDKFADDFANYRNGTSDLHPALQAAFQRFESKFRIAFKHRHLIEQNHKLHTGIFGDTLLALLDQFERTGSLAQYMETPLSFPEPGIKSLNPTQFFATPSKTLH